MGEITIRQPQDYVDLRTHPRIAEHRNAEARPHRLVVGHPDSELTDDLGRRLAGGRIRTKRVGDYG